MIMTSEYIFFSIFIIFIVSMLMIDLLFVGRKSHVVSLREASIWSFIWINSAILFYVFLLHFGDHIHNITNFEQLSEKIRLYAPHVKSIPGDLSLSIELYNHNMAMEFITGYLIEYTLSIDNIFVIMMILSAFNVSEKHYKGVLFWGILGAIILRCIFIFAGSALIQRFEWILLVFGAFLIYTGIVMFINRNKEDKIDPAHHWLVKWLSKHFPVFPNYVDKRFFIRHNKKSYITPLLVVLILIEFTDIVFALDSIPAIFAVTRDPYIVFFSNIFAIIGLRSLFFLLIKVVHLFHYLKIGISVLLVFVGIKLLFHGWLVHIGFKTVYSLYFILIVIMLSVLLSLIFPKKETMIE